MSTSEPTAKALDPIFVDCYADDVGGRPPNIPALAADHRINGIIVKATEGDYYRPAWFLDCWQGLTGERSTSRHYGTDWFRGAYHYLKFNLPGPVQADYFLSAVERAGGWDRGDLWPIVDVELGSEKDSNHWAEKTQVEDCTSAFSERVKAKTGRSVVLYGNGAMRDLGIKSRMGCDYLWIPRYTSTLPAFTYERAGWDLHTLLMWQYSGDGQGYLHGYPVTAPGLPKCDLSVYTLDGGLARLQELLRSTSPGSSKPSASTPPGIST